MKKQTIYKLLTLLLLLTTLAFIFGNSMQSKDESSALSGRFTAFIKPILGVFIGEENVTEHLVRKTAHFAEFGLLGVSLMLYSSARQRRSVQNAVNCAFVGLLAALTDETIQLFFDRGSQVADVWLDFSGALTGILFILLAFIICDKKNKLQT